jgi:hypothetical protein
MAFESIITNIRLTILSPNRVKSVKHPSNFVSKIYLKANGAKKNPLRSFSIMNKMLYALNLIFSSTLPKSIFENRPRLKEKNFK